MWKAGAKWNPSHAPLISLRGRISRRRNPPLRLKMADYAANPPYASKSKVTPIIGAANIGVEQRVYDIA
jgi:hypothetical protein